VKVEQTWVEARRLMRSKIAARNRVVRRIYGLSTRRARQKQPSRSKSSEAGGENAGLEVGTGGAGTNPTPSPEDNRQA